MRRSMACMIMMVPLSPGLKKYGRTGVVVYLSLSFTVTTCEHVVMHMHARSRPPQVSTLQ